MKKKNNILIIGSGAREHALGWKFKQSPRIDKIYFAPGTAGTELIGKTTNIAFSDIPSLITFAKENAIDLTVAGPDDALAAGVVNSFQDNGLNIFGPTKEAAQIESSKAFAKKIMQEENIPTATYQTFTSFTKAKNYLQKQSLPIVIKASGLALGKGVIIAQTKEAAEKTLEDILIKKVFGDAGKEVIIEEFLIGPEISIHAFSDGENVSLFPAARDHKPIFEGNHGPNTGGMGTIAPLPEITDEQLEEIKKTIVLPIIQGLKKRGMPFVGCLYPGLILTKEGPKVLEFNARFGDPEMESYMRLLETDILDILIACTEGKLNKQRIIWSIQAACCIVLASAGYPVTSHKGDVIKGLEKVGKQKDIVVFHFATKKVQGVMRTNGGRVLGVTAVGKNLDEAVDKAYAAIGKDGIHFAGMQYRKDIGRIKKSKIIESDAGAKQSLPEKITRLEVFSKIPDTRAVVKKKKLQGVNEKIKKVSLADVYTIDKGFSENELQRIAETLSNPTTQSYTFSPNQSFKKKSFTWAIEIGFLPGVTDNIATTAKETIADLLDKPFNEGENIHTSQLIFLEGDINKKEAEEIATMLYNPLIQRMHLKSFKEYQKDNGMDIIVPKVKLEKEPEIREVNLSVSDEELTVIGKKGIANSDAIGARRGPLALDLVYMKIIQKYFKKLKRNPTDIELESIAQTWSEHCKHTIFADPIDEIKEGLFKRYIKQATEEIRKKKGKRDFCVSVFTDNSGGIAFDNEYLITHKVETHNSPSALDPFGGAITGIVGVNRDALGFGLGAKPVANMYGYCLADPRKDIPLYKGKNQTQKMLSSRRIMDGVIDGVNAGGNQSGIPTPQGFMYFDERYRGKPLVFVGTVGLIPRKIQGKLSHVKEAQPGDYIVMIGGRVGKDGIHGATFSSEALDSGSPASAVQIGDPITQKKLSDALVKEARDQLLYTSITDNGAGGLSCSVSEMAKESGGCLVELEKIPLKYPGLDPWEIWISESQERMTLALPPQNWQMFSDLMQRRGVEATVIGTFTKSGKCIVTYHDKTIMDLDLAFLHDGLPQRPMTTRKPKNVILERNDNEAIGSVSRDPISRSSSFQDDGNKILLNMLSRLNITSYEFISQQYDSIVQGSAVLGPLQGRGRVNADTSVLRPVLTSQKGVILSQALYPAYSDIDPYAMAASTIDTAIRNAVAAGANPDQLALLDNFCWCSPDDPERLWQLKEAVKACYDYALAYQTPFVSGKDSMFNNFNGFDKKGKLIKIAIPPTLLISTFGVVDDITKVVSLDSKKTGDLLYILGETYEELGGSEYFALQNAQSLTVPQVNAIINSKLYKTLYQAIQKNLIASSTSIGRGGLAVAAAKKALGGMLGLTIDLQKIPGQHTRDDFALYSESQGRILITVARENKNAFEEIIRGNTFANIGKITKDPAIEITGLNGKSIIEMSLKKALKVYKQTFKDY
ncbi:MAG: phosphoribosylamine--glycine ligase [Patescibacteria group bacterium]|mgnify:CR=1 FL=1